MRVPAPAPLLPAGCGAGSPGAFPAPLSASGYPAEVSLLGLGTFRLCACWATPGQRLPILAHGAARLRLRGHRHTTVTVTGELLPPTPCAPAPRRGLPALAPTWGPCFFWRGVGGRGGGQHLWVETRSCHLPWASPSPPGLPASQTSWGSPRPLGRGLPPKSDWFGLSSRQAPPSAPGPTLGSQASAKAYGLPTARGPGS